ncbi:MAG TPA: acetyl-CoA carboxylase biotin carboxylase subunit [Thermoanaerobaculia bacterium]|nr:acetyl-CoA carboxylase biotin carboxylase subunit [Thermoanaerobaculia bacterium]
MKVLIANRGEIAVRIIRACREMGFRTVAVYSEADRAALHAISADESVAIGPAASAESYLRIERILDAAERSGADAVHPGYGFLAENAEFAAACEEAGLTFIGPSPEAIRAMGSKTEARTRMKAAGVPIVPGLEEPVTSLDDLRAFAAASGYPLMVKASAGGGGKGMRQVDREEDLAAAFERVRSEATSFFGDGAVYAERRIASPRHIEVQVLGDRHGTLIHLGERECTLQRRHQKVVEECPSPVVDAEFRARLGEAALRAAAAVGYSSAGTIEFLMDPDRRFYFLEMNTRLQVEHPVTEEVYGIDLVKQQLRIARGDRLGISQEQMRPLRHAIECRIYAEDPYRSFAPSPGEIRYLHMPQGPGIRNDNGVYEGWSVPLHYDPMLSKLIATGSDRQEAIVRMRRALREYRVEGIETSIPFYSALLADPAFERGEFDTGFIDEFLARSPIGSVPDELVEAAIEAAAILAFEEAQKVSLPAAGDSKWRRTARLEATVRGRR